MEPAPGLVIRPYHAESDRAAVQALDTSYETNTIFRVAVDGWTLALAEEAVSPPFRKRFEIGSPEGLDCVLVAEVAGAIAGLSALRLEAWNRRAVIEHLYVAPAYRGRGIARQLLDRLADEAHRRNARCLWLEAQTTNPAAIRFYRAAGFQWCGLDTALYDPARVSPDEVALFFTRPLE